MAASTFFLATTLGTPASDTVGVPIIIDALGSGSGSGTPPTVPTTGQIWPRGNP